MLCTMIAICHTEPQRFLHALYRHCLEERQQQAENRKGIERDLPFIMRYRCLCMFDDLWFGCLWQDYFGLQVDDGVHALQYLMPARKRQEATGVQGSETW